MRISNVGYSDMMDLCPWMMYSRLRVPFGEPTQTRYELLSRVPAFDGETADTNWYLSNRLPPPNCFSISSIHVLYGRMNERDREEFRSRYMLEFGIGEKVYHQAPLLALPDRLRLIERCKPGRPAQPGYFPDEYPLIVHANMYVSARLIGKRFMLTDHGTGLNVLLVFNGVMARGVQ